MTSGDTGTDWNEIWDLFHEALAQDEDARQAFVDRACGDDIARRDKLGKMLAAHAEVDEARLPKLDTLLDGDEASAISTEPVPGDRFGPYEIEEQIGAGGMGTVYRARQDKPVERYVALKLLQYGMATRDIVARFGAERQALAMMSHSNIARIFDAGATEAGRPYFVMEYVPGSPITAYCDSNRLDIDARLRLFLHVCDGVLHAHQKGIIHRDIKPSNVLVTEENGVGVPKIIDFGIAKATQQRLNEKSLYTRVGTLIGTPGYMSPEQAGVVPIDVDTRADVYSLGVLLYELLVGMLPFEATVTANGLLEIQEAIRDEEPQRPSHRLSGISDELRSQISENRAMRVPNLERSLHSDIEWILLKAMDKNRERRYPSVAEFAAEINRYLDGMPIQARAPTRRYRAAKFVRRHAVGVSVAGAIAALVVAFAGAMTVQSFKLQRALDQTTLERNRAEQVSDFMVELFEGANPEVVGRNDVTAAEMLEQGSIRLQEELSNQPELRARLAMTVGESYRTLGGAENYATAITLLEQALEDLDSPNTQSEQLAAVFNSMGAVKQDMGDYEESEVSYQRALALLGTAEDSRLKSDILGNLSVLYTDRGNLSDAEDYARASLDILSRVVEPRDPVVARLKQRLAFILHQQKNSDEAQAMMLDSLAIVKEHYGASHLFVASALNYAAIIQGGGGDRIGAQRSLKEAAEIYRNVHGDEHPYLATTLSNLAMQYNRTGDFDEAVEALSEALRIGIASYGPDHPNVNAFRVNLGTTLQDMGRLVEAEPLLREGLIQDRKTLEPGSPYLLATLDRFGATLNRLGKRHEAEPLLREAADMRREFLGERDAETGVAILNLALNRLEQGAIDDAERLAIESRVIQQALADPSDPLAQSLAGIGSVRYAQGRSDEARDFLQEALSMFGPATENTVLSITLAGKQLAGIEQEEGNLDEARRIYLAAESTLSEHVPDGHPDLVRLLVARSLLDCQTTDVSEGLESIRSTRPLLAQALGADNPELEEINLAAEQCLAYR